VKEYERIVQRELRSGRENRMFVCDLEWRRVGSNHKRQRDRDESIIYPSSKGKADISIQQYPALNPKMVIECRIS
jgi:hypothetical protein